MKKTKLLSTILAMVLVAGMLAACGRNPRDPVLHGARRDGSLRRAR